MVPLNSPEDHEASSSQTSECASARASASNCCPQQPTQTQCNHLLNKAAQECVEEEKVSNARRASTSVPNSQPSSSIISQAKHNNNNNNKNNNNFLPHIAGLGLPSSLKPTAGQAAAGAASMSGRNSAGSAPDTLPSNSATWMTAEEAIRRQQENHVADDSLQWIQALELQMVGACRSDERLRPLLRWNVSCFGSDGRLLAHLGQHFKARELALLARCLCTPVVSLRVGKVSRHGRYLYPTSARGYLNLMLLPCSEMRLSFADDVGTVERVAITISGVESGGILIQELKQDTSRRTFVLKDRGGNIINYFWQSEKLKSTGDELITKIRNMLKRRPTLAHFTGIDEGRLDSFADYLRTAIFSKASNALKSQMSNPTQLVPSSEPDEESSKTPSKNNSNSPLKLATFPMFSTLTNLENLTPSQASHSRLRDPVISQPLDSSMEKQQRRMSEIVTSVRLESSIPSSLSAIAKLIESLKRLQNCLYSLSDKRSITALTLHTTSLPSSQVESQLENSHSKPNSLENGAQLMKFSTEPLIRNVLSASRFSHFSVSDKYLQRILSSVVLNQSPMKIPTRSVSGLYACSSGNKGDVNALQALASTTVVYRDLGSTLESASCSLQAQPVQYPSVTKFLDFSRLILICPSDDGFILSDLFTHSVPQIPLGVSHLPNETLCTHSSYVLPFLWEHAGASAPSLSVVLPQVLDHVRRAKFWHPACSGYGVLCLCKSLPMSYAPEQMWGRRSGPYLVENDIVMHPDVQSRESGNKSRKPGLEVCHDMDTRARNSIAQCGTCHRCATGTGLSNLVLVNFYAQQTGPRLRVVRAEVTSGNISYIVRFLQSF